MKQEVEFIGKSVKDMYGAYMGKVLGTVTEIDGSIQTVGIDCGSEGLKQVPFEQLVSKGDVVIYIPKWRLDSQKLLREKGMTLRRLKALMDIVSENDDMKNDAEIIHEKYKSKLMDLEQTESSIKTKLEARLDSLEEQSKSVKTLIFDAKVQFKSDEISESTFESVKTHSNNLIEHITHEKAEIAKVLSRIADLSLDTVQPVLTPKQHIQESAMTYLESANGTVTQTSPEQQSPMTTEPSPSISAEIPNESSEPSLSEFGYPQTSLPEPPEGKPTPNGPAPESSQSEPKEKKLEQEPSSDWLTRMEAQ